jgi:protein-disulfide isomerase
MKERMRIIMMILAAAALPLFSAEHEQMTKVQGDAILDELRQIRMLLAKGSAPAAAEPSQAAKVRIGNEPMLGDKNAPFTMVEYTDTRCGFCRRFHTTAFAEIRKNLIETGKVRFVSRDLPLDVNSPSLRAAETIRCAGEQNRYWQLRDALMTGQSEIDSQSIAEAAKKLGLDMPELNACIDSAKYRVAVENDIKEAAALNIGGTPTFVIGKTIPEGVDGVIVVGALPYSVFEAKLREIAK